jgi:uncharacterized cupin superfamily protein
MTSLIHLNADTVRGVLEPIGPRLGADHGDPQMAMRPINPANKDQAGIWECAPGGWRVVDRPATETFYVISGKAILTDDATGFQNEIGPGDFVVTPQGWSGRWDVIETIRKVYTNFSN